MKFGERVAVMLELRGWSQGLLAQKTREAQERIGEHGSVHQSTISRIVGEGLTPSLPIAAAIALALDTSLDWLVGIRGDTAESVAKTPDEAELLRNYRAIRSPAVKAMALEMVARGALVNGQSQG